MQKSINPKKFFWKKAPDVKKRVQKLIKTHGITWLSTKDVFFVRSWNSKARAYARIWGLSRIWQEVLEVSPKYIIEVLAETFDKLNNSKKDDVLIHEIAHIPKNFSGSLVPHFRKGKKSFRRRIINIRMLRNS